MFCFLAGRRQTLQAAEGANGAILAASHLSKRQGHQVIQKNINVHGQGQA